MRIHLFRWTTTFMTTNAQPPSEMRSAIAGVIEQLVAERRWLIVMRLVFSAASLSWLLFLSWAFLGSSLLTMIPDSSTFAALGFILAAGAAFCSIAYWVVWRPTLQHESSAEFVRVLFGGGLLIRRPGQFKSRLGAARRRARRARKGDRWTFSLIVLELPEPAEPDRRGQEREFEDRLFAIAVRSVARSGDIVAEVSSGEVWLLAMGASEDILPTIVGRLAGTFADPASSLPAFANMRIGGATYGEAGPAAKELFASAKGNLTPVAELAPVRQAA